MNRNLAPIKGTLYRGMIPLMGRLDIPAGGAAASATSVFLGGLSTPFVKQGGTGIFRLFLAEPVVGPTFVQLTMHKATAENLGVEVVSDQSTAATPYIEFRTKLDSTGAAANAVAACKVYVTLWCVDSQGNP
jgi:hypothetical protein